MKKYSAAVSIIHNVLQASCSYSAAVSSAHRVSPLRTKLLAETAEDQLRIYIRWKYRVCTAEMQFLHLFFRAWE